MFIPKTETIRAITEKKTGVIKELEILLSGKTRIYIDYANVRPWSQKLGWHIEPKRLKQFLDSFDNIEAVNFYSGFLEGDERSEKEKTDVENCKYTLRTKPVKIMKFPIDAARVPDDSTAILDQFVRRSLLRKYEVGTVEYLNMRFRDMNKRGEYWIEDRKCNFDVEIGIDMLLDCERNNAEVFVLWSGDSDFSDPVKKLISVGKKVVLFATAGKVSRELGELGRNGLIIFDIQKINDFICWKREIGIKSKRSFLAEGPKH